MKSLNQYIAESNVNEARKKKFNCSVADLVEWYLTGNGPTGRYEIKDVDMDEFEQMYDNGLFDAFDSADEAFDFFKKNWNEQIVLTDELIQGSHDLTFKLKGKKLTVQAVDAFGSQVDESRVDEAKMYKKSVWLTCGWEGENNEVVTKEGRLFDVENDGFNPSKHAPVVDYNTALKAMRFWFDVRSEVLKVKGTPKDLSDLENILKQSFETKRPTIGDITIGDGCQFGIITDSVPVVMGAEGYDFGDIDYIYAD